MRPSYRDEEILHTACVCRFQKYSAFSLSILLYIIIINKHILRWFLLLTTHAHKHTWLNVINHLANSCYILCHTRISDKLCAQHKKLIYSTGHCCAIANTSHLIGGYCSAHAQWEAKKRTIEVTQNASFSLRLTKYNYIYIYFSSCFFFFKIYLLR